MHCSWYQTTSLIVIYVGKDIALKGKFSDINKQFPIDKAALLLDMMEIGERKYTDFRRLCLSERFSFPAYKNIASFRSDITLTNEVKVMNNHGYLIGVGESYSKLLHKTIERILMIIQPVNDCQFPLTLFIADGLDGLGSHRIYNQINQKTYIQNHTYFCIQNNNSQRQIRKPVMGNILF